MISLVKKIFTPKPHVVFATYFTNVLTTRDSDDEETIYYRYDVVDWYNIDMQKCTNRKCRELDEIYIEILDTRSPYKR